jgi:hypothetical protein
VLGVDVERTAGILRGILYVIEDLHIHTVTIRNACSLFEIPFPMHCSKIPVKFL